MLVGKLKRWTLRFYCHCTVLASITYIYIHNNSFEQDELVPKNECEMICPKLKGFRIGHLNIASLIKHKDELSIFILKQHFDVLCINKRRRLDSSICNSEVEIAGYDLIGKDRNRNGGGVAIYVRRVIPYINRTELSPDTAEAICLEIRKPKSKPLLVSAWFCRIKNRNFLMNSKLSLNRNSFVITVILTAICLTNKAIIMLILGYFWT